MPWQVHGERRRSAARYDRTPPPPLVRARLTGREQPTPPRTLLISDRPRVDSLLVLSVLVGDPLEFEVEDGLVLDESFAGDERGLGVGVAQDQLREFERRGL